jgi:subtilase family serine protease
LLWAQAASEGISVFVASGDDGASGCAGDVGGMDAGSLMRAVNGISSTPSNICVGGTMFTEGNGAGTYWSTGPSDYPSALKYIPEAVWYEPANADFAGGASGGGVSTLYSKPSWQVAPGVPAGNRWVPDVALAAAAEHDGYVIYTTGSIGPTLYSAGGTSAASPSFAGIMALVVQATGQRWGNFNTVLYQFGNAQYSTGGNVFHDITTGGNTNWNAGAPAGYPATTGFDPATGLGSVDAANLVDNMNAGITTSLSSAGVITGGSAIFTATVTGIQDVGVTWSVTPAGAKVTPGTPTSTATFTASRAGTYTVTASPSEAALHTASISVQVHDPHLTGAGNTVTGLDVLFLLSQYGSGTAADLNGDGMVDDKDLAILLNLLQTQGW